MEIHEAEPQRLGRLDHREVDEFVAATGGREIDAPRELDVDQHIGPLRQIHHLNRPFQVVPGSPPMIVGMVAQHGVDPLGTLGNRGLERPHGRPQIDVLMAVHDDGRKDQRDRGAGQERPVQIGELVVESLDPVQRLVVTGDDQLLGARPDLLQVHVLADQTSQRLGTVRGIPIRPDEREEKLDA